MQEQLEETRQAFRAQMEDLERIKSQLEQASQAAAVLLRFATKFPRKRKELKK